MRAMPVTRMDWYKSQTMNESARKRLGVTYRSCCDAGDHYRTRFRVAGDNSDQWLYLAKDGQWKVVPPDIIKQQDTPENQPVLFINQRTGVELCFLSPKAGSSLFRGSRFAPCSGFPCLR